MKRGIRILLVVLATGLSLASLVAANTSAMLAGASPGPAA